MQVTHKLFPKDPGAPQSEELRVIGRDQQYTIVRLIRTESAPQPECWRLLTRRIPEELTDGSVFRVRFTPMELEWMQGKRELGE
jgi:hypothetical protein